MRRRIRQPQPSFLDPRLRTFLRRPRRRPAPAEPDGHAAATFAAELRLQLAREHLDRDAGDTTDLLDPETAFAAFRDSAALLDRWHQHSQNGNRPPGRLRSYPTPTIGWHTRAWAIPLYRILYDPDGRPLTMRIAHRY